MSLNGVLKFIDGESQSISPSLVQAASPSRVDEDLSTSALASLCTSVISVDPGQREGSTILLPSGEFLEKQEFEEFVKTLPRGTEIATETTVHSYRPEDRKSLLRTAVAHGVNIYGMRAIFTSRARKELGLKKSNKNDATAIGHYFITRRNLFYKLRADPPGLGTKNEPGTPRFEVNYRLVALRREGYPGYEDVHDATRQILCDVGTQFNLSKRQFKRLAGYHGTGYPAIPRSNRNLHGAGKDVAQRKPRMKEIRRKTFAEFTVRKTQAITPSRAPEDLDTSALRLAA